MKLVRALLEADLSLELVGELLEEISKYKLTIRQQEVGELLSTMEIAAKTSSPRIQLLQELKEKLSLLCDVGNQTDS